MNDYGLEPANFRAVLIDPNYEHMKKQMRSIERNMHRSRDQKTLSIVYYTGQGHSNGLIKVPLERTVKTYGDEEEHEIVEYYELE